MRWRVEISMDDDGEAMVFPALEMVVRAALRGLTPEFREGIFESRQAGDKGLPMWTLRIRPEDDE